MNLVTMRTRFTEHVSDLSNDLVDADIDEYLNRAYQYTIPADVGGEFSETTWTLTCIPPITNAYAYPDYVIGVSGDAPHIGRYLDGENTDVSISRTFLKVETNSSTWAQFDDFHPDGTTSARPTTILFYGRTAYIDPNPDLAYRIVIPCRGGPQSVLSDIGIPNDIHAMAAVTAAALEFLAETEDQDGAMREQALYESYRSRLNVYAQVRPNSRRRKRSF